ncbi:hypothetical protein B0H14DRAFT_2698767 [Mycena olivaceomarginata]|nr:hypothetical protein B0H14DRAFT_2698767 [Mycena olivaceomarginata]
MATRLISVLRLLCNFVQFGTVSLVCTALSWPRLGSRDSTNTPRGKPDPELFGAEVSGLLANYAALQEYSHRPDCFCDVAGKIERRCGTLEMDNDARVEAAISMTLCELATATHHSPPLECASFAMDGRSQGECVDALSRSPQFWSSYSGYLREVPQLCFAFRRWNDIDTARDTYRNATIEITNLKLWDIQLSELANVASRLKIAFNTMDVLISGVAPRFEHELTRIVKEFKADLQEAQTRKQSHTADQIGSDLQLILKEFSTQSLQTFNLINSAQDMWTNLTLQFSTMRQEMFGLSEGISGTLKASVGLAQEMREAQSSASISASNLGEALTWMTTTTYESLERINASAGMITESLKPGGSLSQLIWLMEVVSRIDLRHVPIFGMVSALLGFFLYLFRSVCSVLMLHTTVISASNNTNERDNAATLGTAELLKLCQTLEKVCVAKGDPAQNMELSNALRIVRRHVQRGEMSNSKQLTLAEAWGVKSNT